MISESFFAGFEEAMYLQAPSVKNKLIPLNFDAVIISPKFKTQS